MWPARPSRAAIRAARLARMVGEIAPITFEKLCGGDLRATGLLSDRLIGLCGAGSDVAFWRGHHRPALSTIAGRRADCRRRTTTSTDDWRKGVLVQDAYRSTGRQPTTPPERAGWPPSSGRARSASRSPRRYGDRSARRCFLQRAIQPVQVLILGVAPGREMPEDSVDRLTQIYRLGKSRDGLRGVAPQPTQPLREFAM